MTVNCVAVDCIDDDIPTIINTTVTANITINTSTQKSSFVPPYDILLYDEKFKIIPNGTVIGPLDEGKTLKITCEVLNTRPKPSIKWYRGSQRLQTHLPIIAEDDDGLFTAKLELMYVVSRQDLEDAIECRVESAALNETSKMFIKLDVQVRPYNIKFEFLGNRTVEGTLTTLKCEVSGARPAANISWTNGTKLIKNDDEKQNILIRSLHNLENGVYNTISELTFTASRFENNVVFGCDAINLIMERNKEKPMHAEVSFEVYYPPTVELIMNPKSPINEGDFGSINITCSIVEGNPFLLTNARWYKNSLLLDLPNCDGQTPTLCIFDTKNIKISRVDHNHAGNFSCKGSNEVGWGGHSKEVELVVFYPPGKALITYFPLIVVKNRSVKFTCNVPTLGLPIATQYHWYRNGIGPMTGLYNKSWQVETVDLSSQANYTCYAYNQVGKGASATVQLHVQAPPFFIRHLERYTGVLYSKKNVKLICVIECVPTCKVNWIKNGFMINSNKSDKYYIEEIYLPENHNTGVFKSVLSVLNFNMTAWPNKQFDIYSDNANYTCISSENDVGPGVHSTTFFRIEYPPDNTTVSDTFINVTENSIPKQVLFKSYGNPEASYTWKLNNRTIILGNTLKLREPFLRNESGYYTCIANNVHGSDQTTLYINVQYRPSCSIDRKIVDDKDTLICSAYGNPNKTKFEWSVRADNASFSIIEDFDSVIDQSYFILKNDFFISKTYRCLGTNVLGVGYPCEIDVKVYPKKKDKMVWWKKWDNSTLIIVSAIIGLILLAAIIICCAIICLCQKKQRQVKIYKDTETQTQAQKSSQTETEPNSSRATKFQNSRVYYYLAYPMCKFQLNKFGIKRPS